MSVGLLGPAEVAEMLGVERRTVQQWRYRGLLPEPHTWVDGSPAWHSRTIRTWAIETGRMRSTGEITRRGGS